MAMFSRRSAADFLTFLAKNQRFRFWRDTRAAATALMGVAVVVMSIGAGAVISDHLWVSDQRDKLKSATDAASVAAMVEMNDILLTTPNISDLDLQRAVEAVARRYVTANLGDLPPDRYTQAAETLQLELVLNRDTSTLTLNASADLGGYLFASMIPLLSGATPLTSVGVSSAVEQAVVPTHIVLALDTSLSMAKDLQGNFRGTAKGDLTKDAAKALVNFMNPTAHNRIAFGVVPWDALVKLDVDAQQVWRSEGWARYPRSRRYGAAFACRPFSRCSIFEVRNEDLPYPSPVLWEGCLNEQRVDVGDHASRPPDEELLDHPATAPFAEAIYAATHAMAYNCQHEPVPNGFGSQLCYGSDAGAHERATKEDAQFLCDASPMRPLSADVRAIKRHINRLSFEGDRTYSALGVLWAQRMLMHQWADVWDGDVDPIDPEVDEAVRKVIVLFTDGFDTQCGLDLNYRNCDFWDVGLVRNVACSAAKAAGTEIFVIAAIPDIDSEIGQELRDCSSHDEDSDVQYTFLNINTDDDIAAAFASIGLELKTLRRTY